MPLDYCFYDENMFSNNLEDKGLYDPKIIADPAFPCTIQAQNFALFYWPSSATGQCTKEGIGRFSVQSERVIKLDSLVMTLPKVSHKSSSQEALSNLRGNLVS